MASIIICLNLAGVVMFFAQRIRTRTAWKAERARRSLWTAIGIWIVLLVALSGLVMASGAHRPT